MQTTSTRYPLDWTAVAFFAVIHAITLSAPWFFSWNALGVTLFLHWLLGSIGICLGYHRLLSHRSFQVPWAAILTYGEGWHNNHHAHPNVAKAGWRWWEYDPTWWAIWLLKKVGIARKVVMPPT